MNLVKEIIMKRIFKNMLAMLIGITMYSAAQEKQHWLFTEKVNPDGTTYLDYDSPLSIRDDLIVIGNSIKKISQQTIDYVRTNTPEWIAQTSAYLAEMPKPAEGASCYGYATAGNAKNMLAKAGAVAVVAAAGYGIYKLYKHTQKNSAILGYGWDPARGKCCAQCSALYDFQRNGCPSCGCERILKRN
jgi:hypothetical protein